MSKSSIYLPDPLYERVVTFAKDSDLTLDEALQRLLSKGLVSKDARDYLDLLLQRNFLRRSELYSEYSKDGLVLRRLVDQMKNENSETRQLLIEKGLLRRIPEKHRS